MQIPPGTAPVIYQCSYPVFYLTTSITSIV